ncbi:hypothetical protein AX16_006805 [Volvariella volvacea WC 439]|nr:hypothetical protein AX16_006805 [Volvariella volvacea WC 439]
MGYAVAPLVAGDIATTAPSFDPSLAKEIFHRNCSSLAALFLLIWDVACYFDKEILYIWRFSWSRGKLLYLYSRYLPVCSQSASTIFMFTICNGLAPTKNEYCRLWYGLLGFTTQSLFFCIEVVSLYRVYALYGQNRSIFIFLICLIAASNVTQIVMGVRLGLAIPFDDNCMATSTPQDIIYCGVTLVLTHGILFTMTHYKRNKREFRRIAPVVKLMVRDGKLLFAALAIVPLATIPYSMLIQSSVHLFFPWVMSIVSLSTSRFILNTQRLQAAEGTIPPQSISGTAEIDTIMLDTYISEMDPPSTTTPPRCQPAVIVNEGL